MANNEETQLLGDDPNGNSSDGGSHLSDETLEVEDSFLYEETQAVDDDSEVGYVGTETQLVDDSDTDGVDSDAPTDDGGCSSKEDTVPSELPQGRVTGRGIASVPAASLRSSGLSAAHEFSINNSDGCNDLSNRVSNASSPDTRTSEPNETKNSAKNKVAKRLSYVSPTVEEDISKPGNNIRLSYVQSQEPGELSQANALNVVDDLLTINFLGLSQSQEGNNSKRNDDLYKSPPISSIKGAHTLVKSVDHRSPVGKQGTFEWIDNLEDDGGGEFFTKRGNLFFNRKDSKHKSRSVNVGKKGAQSTNHKKVANLTRSASRFSSRKSLLNAETNAEKTIPKKNLLNDLNEQSDLKSKEKDNGISDQDAYEFGPDTQMAAEVLGELIRGSPLGDDKLDAQSTPIVIGVSTRSKSNQRNYNNVTSNMGAQKNLVCTNEKLVSKRERKNNKNEANASFVDEVEHDKERKGVSIDEFQVNSTPIAHCTRNSKVVKLSDTKKDTDATINLRTCGIIARQGMSITDICGSSKTNRKGSDMVPVQDKEADKEFTRKETECHETKRKRADMFPVQNSEPEKDLTGQEIGCQETKRKRSDTVPVQNSEPEKDLSGQETEYRQTADAETHPRNKRTRHVALKNSNNSNCEAPSPFDDGEKSMNRKKKIYKTISEIMDAAERKRRSFSTSNIGKKPFVSSVKLKSSLKYQSCNFDKEAEPISLIGKQAVVEDGKALESIQPSNDGEQPFTSSVRTRSSLKSHLYNSYRENGAVENGKSEEPPKQKQIKNADCIAEGNVRKRGRPRSVNARELTNSETSSPTSGFNTRRRREMSSVRVLFSNHLDGDIVKQQTKIIRRLGVPIANSIFDATHFVTDGFVRTRNMLEAMAQGKPVVTHLWLESCGQAGCFVDEKKYIMRDAMKEREIGFSMPVSLARACQKPLLEGRRAYVTKNIKPSREIISSLVKAAGGQRLERLGRLTIKDDKIFDELLILSCEDDYAECIPFLERGAEIFSSELLLNGIVMQALEYPRHRLFLDYFRRTRSTTRLRQEGSNEKDNKLRSITKCT